MLRTCGNKRSGKLYPVKSGKILLFVCLLKGRIAPLPHESNSYLQSSPGYSLSDFHIDYKLEKHKPRGGPCTSGVAILMK